MSDDPKTPAQRSSPTEGLFEVMANDLTYCPNPEQRKVKEAFWARWAENPTCEPQDISLAVVLGWVGDNRLKRWWGQSGFKEWFKNQEEFRERVAVMAHLALDTLQSILVNENAQPSARVNAAKLAMELARKMPQKEPPKDATDPLNKMDRKQLEAFITRNSHLLPIVPNPLTDPSPSDTVKEATPSPKSP